MHDGLRSACLLVSISGQGPAKTRLVFPQSLSTVLGTGTSYTHGPAFIQFNGASWLNAQTLLSTVTAVSDITVASVLRHVPCPCMHMACGCAALSPTSCHQQCWCWDGATAPPTHCCQGMLYCWEWKPFPLYSVQAFTAMVATLGYSPRSSLRGCCPGQGPTAHAHHADVLCVPAERHARTGCPACQRQHTVYARAVGAPCDGCSSCWRHCHRHDNGHHARVS